MISYEAMAVASAHFGDIKPQLDVMALYAFSPVTV